MSEAVVPDAAQADDQSSFEQALAAALAQQTTEAEPEPEAAAPAPEPAKPADPAAPAAAAAPDAPSAAQLERAAALEAREAKLREAEAKAAALDKREAELAAREARTAKQWDAFAADPVGHIMAMQPELTSSQAAQVAEKIYFHALGDKAPPEYRQRQEVARVETKVSSEVEKLRAELEEERASRARMVQETEIATYKAELRSGAAAVTDAPIVASLAKRNPERVEELLFEVARRAAVESRERGEAEPVVLTPAQAASQLEAILKAQRDELFGPAEAPPQAQQTQSPTITNRDASIQPSRTAPDPFDDKELRKAALKAAGLEHLTVWD